MAVFPLFYAGSIEYFKAIAACKDAIQFEVFETYPKQTYRSRCYIAGANGLQKLIIPIQHTKSRVLKDIKVVDTQSWQAEHWKSLQAAYRKSPYFEYYEDDLKYIYTKSFEYLIDFNKILMEWILKMLHLEVDIVYTVEYKKTIALDFRNEFNSKNLDIRLNEYSQVFQEKHGFISNLSILDLIFNKGPEALSYLK